MTTAFRSYSASSLALEVLHKTSAIQDVYKTLMQPYFDYCIRLCDDCWDFKGLDYLDSKIRWNEEEKQ